MLPGGNGLDILRAIREKKNPVGVIIVSAKDSVDDKVKGLEIGADDYLAKPFHLPELSMRIYAIIRRKMFAVNNLLSSNRVTIDLLSKSVTANGQPVVLTRTEYELLLFLHQQPEQGGVQRLDGRAPQRRHGRHAGKP